MPTTSSADSQRPILADCVATYLQHWNQDLEFPWGGNVEIPADGELELLSTIERCSPVLESDLLPFRKSLTIHDAYSLVIFAVRMAILGARTNRSQTLVGGLLGLVIDDDILDWRDIVRALSIIDYCGSCLGIDFGRAIDRFLPLASMRRQQIIRDGYLGREPEMRAIDFMGFSAVGDDESMKFVRRY